MNGSNHINLWPESEDILTTTELTNDELNQILGRKGYGIASSLKSSIKSAIKTESILHQAGGEGEVPKLERSVGSKSVRPQELAVPNTGRCTVRIKVFRRRLTDTGNDCWKFHLDALRYIGFLADDNDAAIRLEEEPHEKVESNEEERVEITIEYPNITIEQLIEYYKDGPKNQIHTE